MIIDAHTHVGSLSYATSDSPVSDQPKTDPTTLTMDEAVWTDVMREDGVDQVIVMPSFNYLRDDGIRSVQRLNDAIGELVAEHDLCYAGTATVGLHYRRQTVFDELERVAERGFGAICWHHRFQGGPINDPTTIECVKQLDRLGLAAFVHAYPHSELEAVERVAHLLPHTDQPIIVLAATSDLDNLPKIVDLAEEFDNVYFDLSTMFPLGKIVERLVDDIGADRLVYGSDFYAEPVLFNRSADLFQIRHAEISERAKRQILGDTIRTLLG